MRARRIIAKIGAILVAAALLAGLSVSTAAAASGDTLNGKAKVAADKALKGYSTTYVTPSNTVPLERVKGGVNYAGLKVGSKIDADMNVKVRVAVIPTNRADDYRHAVWVYVDRVGDGEKAEVTKAFRTNTALIVDVDSIYGEELVIWAVQDVKGKKSHAKSQRIKVNYADD